MVPSPEEETARDQFYTIIGHGITMWATMEELLILLAATLLGTTSEKAGTVFYSIANFHSWLGIIDDLFALDERALPFRPEWAKIAGKLRGLNDIRVRLAHHWLPFGEAEASSLGLRPGYFDLRSKSRKQQPLTRDDILEFMRETGTFSHAIGNLNNEILDATETSL